MFLFFTLYIRRWIYFKHNVFLCNTMPLVLLSCRILSSHIAVRTDHRKTETEKENNKSQAHGGRQKIRSTCAVGKKGGRGGIQREGQKDKNEWPISIKVAMLLKVGAEQLKVTSRRMDRTDWIYRSCFPRSMPHTQRPREKMHAGSRFVVHQYLTSSCLLKN